MATSNSRDFSLTAADIITEAAELCGGGGADGTIPTENVTSFLRTLNIMLKAWQGEGLFLHTWRDVTLFFAHDEPHYLLGTTAHATESYVETTLAADAALGATTITLTATTGITALDAIGIVLDDGTMQWTTVTTAATTLIAAALTGAASSGNMVVAYTTAIGRPVEIADVMRKDSNDIEAAVNVISREAYRRKADKTVTGKVIEVFLDPKLGYSGLFTWPCPDDVTDRLTFSCKKVVDDFDATTDTADIPTTFYEALVTGLAYRIAPKYRLSQAERQDLKERADIAKANISDSESGTSLFIFPRMR